MSLEPRLFSRSIAEGASTAAPVDSAKGSKGAAAQETSKADKRHERASPGPAGAGGAAPESPGERAEYFSPGTERFVRAPRSRPTETQATEGDVTLNFGNTNILEVVKVILGDLLQQNYRIGPGVQGQVTLQTSHPIRREALLPTLEMLLRSNGAALVRQGGLYHVVQQEKALQGFVSPQLGDRQERLPRGYQVRIVPLAFISADEMNKILEPFTSGGNIVRVDTPRNLLILAGSGPELARLIETIRVFDVDWMAGMSIAMFRPDFVDAKTLASELRKVLDDEMSAPLSGVIRIVDLERLNALMVITPRKVYLERVAEWIKRLDRVPGGVGQRLYVYHVQNGRAAELADVLSKVFEVDSVRVSPAGGEVAPGLKPVNLRSATPRGAKAGAKGKAPAPKPPSRQPPRETRRSNVGGDGLTLTATPTMRIIADEINNALLVKATAQEYRLVSAALRQLDIVPLQVLVEATIAEITLTGNLQFGLEWFFKNHHGGNRTGTGTLDLGAEGLSAIVPGFSYAITESGGAVQAVLNALAAESRVNILSSPSLMVLNNQTATINVGDEVPVTTQQQQSTTTNSTVVNNIEFRNTGVLLTVTPRVNAGGLVTMEIEQEVSNVAAGTGNSLTPTIQQRKITSSVAVRSGDTVVLGGLIRENTSATRSGVPGLYSLPVVGALFGNDSQEQRRTELVVLITPRSVENRAAARRITEEFRNKMEALKPPPGPGRPPAESSM